MDSDLPNINFLFSNISIDVILFITVIISLLVMTLVIFILCKHTKLKILVTGLVLQQIKEVGAVTRHEYIMPNRECTCKIQ